MNITEYLRENETRMRQMRHDGEAWEAIAAAVEKETGETVNVSSFRKTFSRLFSTSEAPAPVEKIVKQKAARLPAKIEKMVDFETVEPKAKDTVEPQIPADQPPPASRLEEHLTRLIAHRVRLMGWTDFIHQEDLLDRLKNRHQNVNLYKLSDIQPDAPFAHLLTSWTRSEFGRFMAKKIDVQGFWKDRVGGDVEAREMRVFQQYKTDRRTLLNDIVSALIDDDQGFVDWLLYFDGRGYYNVIQQIDNEVAAGRGGSDINAVINRVAKQVKSAYLYHLELGQAA